MQTIGLIGGMSWESTALYYRIINEYIKEKLRGLHSAKILMYSVDFAEIEYCQSLEQWDKSAEILTDAAKRLEIGGAYFIVICTNTMHKVAPQVEKNINIPILHIADTTAAELATSNIKKTALLGTKYTMTQEFYKERIAAKGIDIVVPSDTEIEIVNGVIYDELCMGIVSEKSRAKFQKIISRLKNEENAEAVILGCTEIGLLIKQSDSPLPVFDTTYIHAQAAAKKALFDEVKTNLQ